MNKSVTFDRFIFLIILLFVGSLPYSIAASNTLLTFLLFLIIYYQVKMRQFYINLPSILMVLFMCYYSIEILGLIHTENIEDGLKIVERHIPLIIIPVLFYYKRFSEDDRFKILGVFVMSCFVASLICIFVNIYRSMEYDRIFHEWMFAHDQFSDPIQMQAVYFSIYVAFSLLIILCYAVADVDKERELPWWLLTVTIPILSLSLILMGARTVTMVTLLLVLGILFYSAWTKRALIFGVAALLIVLVFSLFVAFHPVLKNRFRDLVTSDSKSIYYDGYNSRLRIWKPGMKVIKDNFWLGVGTGDDQDLLDREFIKSNYIEGVGIHNMHNQYLQSLLSYGILGLILIVCIFGFQFWIAIRQRNILYLSFLILVCFSMLTESVLNRNKGVLFVVFFSLLLFPNRYFSKS